MLKSKSWALTIFQFQHWWMSMLQEALHWWWILSHWVWRSLQWDSTLHRLLRYRLHVQQVRKPWHWYFELYVLQGWRTALAGQGRCRMTVLIGRMVAKKDMMECVILKGHRTTMCPLSLDASAPSKTFSSFIFQENFYLVKKTVNAGASVLRMKPV